MAQSPALDEDSEARFDALLRSEKRRLYGIAYSILRDHGEAEDALQGAMFKAWKSWSSLRQEEARIAWLTRICVNHCINHRKGLRLRAFPGSARADEKAPDDPRFAGRMIDLDRSYVKLSTRQRTALFLHYHHGYSVEECADLMSCGAGSVRTHIARALASLRKEMAHV